FQAEDGIRDATVTGVQTCALPIYLPVQLVDDAVRGLLLPLDVRQLVRERVGLGAEPLEFLLHLRALAPDAFEALLVVAQLLIERSEERRVGEEWGWRVAVVSVARK